MENYFFDFDGTLADSGDIAVMATQNTFKKAGLEMPNADVIRGYMGIPIEESFSLMGASKEKLAAMFEFFRKDYQENEKTHVKLFPQIKETLVELKQRQKNIYGVSSKHSEALARNLENLEIAEYFDDLVGSDNVQNYKPAPDGIDLLVKRYDLVREQSVMIGDAIYDIQMGYNANVKTCAVHWGAFDWPKVLAEKPSFTVDEPRQLLEID